MSRCGVCGGQLPPRKSKRGRPRLYHDDCRVFQDGLALLRTGVERLPPLSAAAAHNLAAELMLVRNDIRPHIDTEARQAYGKRLREQRTAAGLTQQQLATAAGIKRKQVSRFETGLRAPAERTMKALERALRVFLQGKTDNA